MQIFFAIIPILLITFLAISFAVFFKKRMAECLPLAVCTPLIITYISGLFGNLIPGLVLTLLICFVAFGYILYLFLKDKEELKGSILHYSSIIYIVLCLFIFYINYGNMFSQGDDFVTGWGGYIKSQYIYNVFSAIAPEHIGLLEYPTGFADLAYFFLKTSLTYNESIALLANGFLVICFAIPLFSQIKIFKYRITSIIISTGLIITVPIIIWIVEGLGYGYLYTDNSLGMMFAYVMFLWYFNDNNKFWIVSSSIVLFSICLFKTNGSVFVAIAIFVVTIDYFFGQNKVLVFQNSKRKTIIQWLKYIFIPLTAAVISFFSWRIYKDLHNIGYTVFNEDNFINMTYKIISGKADPIVYHGIKNTVKYFFTRPMCNLFPNLKLFIIPTTCANIMISILFITLISRILHKSEFTIKRFMVYCIATVFSVVIYTGFYCIGYIGAFNDTTITKVHVLAAASYERYIGSILIGFLLLSFVFLLSYNSFDKYRKFNKTIVIFCIVMWGFLFGAVNDLALKQVIIRSYPSWKETREKIANITSYESYLTDNKNVKIQFICPIANSLQYFYSSIAKYEAIGTGLQIESGPSLLSVGNNSSYISIDEWEKSLKEYSYVYIMEIDDNFKINYGNIFNNMQDIKSMSLYRVVENNRISLELVE